MFEEIYKVYLHTPPHLFRPNAIYMVTGTVFRKQRLLDTKEKKEFFLNTLLDRANFLGWEVEAWAVLPNHYHFIARAPEHSKSLKSLIQALHSVSSKYINRLDRTPGRKVWYNYWDTCITHEASYLARLHYVHVNAAKHGLVQYPEDYPYCSYGWFASRADAEFKRLVLGQPIDRVNVKDDF